MTERLRNIRRLTAPCLGKVLMLSYLATAVVVLGTLNACTTGLIGNSRVVGQNEQFAVVLTGEAESYQQLAKAFYGDLDQDWRISDANADRPLRPGMVIAIPKTDDNRVGIWHDEYQTIPILSYHRFGAGRGTLSVTAEQFEQQMSYLRDHDYRVISLQHAAEFFRGERSIPKKSVVLTIDDGYQSVYHIAYPILAKYGYPATVFIYSDYIGGGGLTWQQMREMEQSGLFSFQAHSKTHADLTKRLPDESMVEYQQRLQTEVAVPGAKLRKRMDDPVFSYAYPFGAVNQPTVDELRRHGFELGLTVKRGGNPFFGFPYHLRRTMIYRSDGLEEFAAALQTYKRHRK